MNDELIKLIWDILDKSGIVIGLVTAFVSIMIWFHLRYKEKKDNELIAIVLTVPAIGKEVTLPGKIRRKNLTRAELQGMLGILPMRESGKRYELDALNNSDFFARLQKAQVDRAVKKVEIICQPRDLEQFDQKRLESICDIKQKLK